jgi:cellulose synthase operon protein C
VDSELDRVAGQPHEAVRKLAAILPELIRGRTMVALREWLAVASRVQTEAPELDGAAEEVIRTAGAGGISSLLGAAVIILGVLAAPGAPRELTTTVLDAARSALESAGRTSGRWSALLREALSRVARERGDENAVRSEALLAAQVYDQLEDRTSRDRVLRDVEQAGPAQEPDQSRRSLVELKVDNAGLWVQVRWRDRQEHRRWNGESSPVVTALLGGGRTSGAQLVPARLSELLVSNWTMVGDELTRLLLGEVEQAFGGDTHGQDLDLRLRIRDPALHLIPWELAGWPMEDGHRELLSLDPRVACLYRTGSSERPDPEDVRTLQMGLGRALRRDLAADGLLGPATRSALAAFQQQQGVRSTGDPDPVTEQQIHADLMGRKPAVTVVRTSVEVEERALRGSSSSGMPVDWLYSRHGFNVVLVEGTNLDELPRSLRKHPTAVVHITAGLVESGGAVVLDLARESAPAGAAIDPITPYRLTPTALDLLLRGSVVKPVIVLDAPAPRSLREVVTQLLLRNAFAGELFALGGTRAVVATGLARYTAQQRLYEVIIDALARGAELGLLVNAVRRLVRGSPGPGDPQHDMAFGAAALFARRAAVRLPWGAA